MERFRVKRITDAVIEVEDIEGQHGFTFSVVEAISGGRVLSTSGHTTSMDFLAADGVTTHARQYAEAEALKAGLIDKALSEEPAKVQPEDGPLSTP